MDYNIELNSQQLQYLQSRSPSTGLVAGVGSGKSYIATLKVLFMKLKYPGMNCSYYLPTYGLIGTIARPNFAGLMDELGLSYTMNKSSNEIHIDGYGTIYLRSLSNPENIVGFEDFYAVIDEVDILRMSTMEIAYNKILARNRQKEPNGAPNIVDVVGTPEGYKFFYHYFQANPIKGSSLIRASTYENKFLPDNYIKTLEAQYPPQLLKAYLEGIFVNLTSGSVYEYFKRDLHNISMDEESIDNIKGKELHVGVDFNIGGSCCTFSYIEDETVYVFDEYAAHDTYDIARYINEKYRKDHRQITLYPDATGRQGSTNATLSDIGILEDPVNNFICSAPKSNPRIADRVNAVNNLFSKNRIFIDTERCPNLASALEKQVYDDNGKPEKQSLPASFDDWNDSFGYLIHRKFAITGNRVTFTQRRFG